MIYEFVNPNKGFYVICVPLIKVLLPWRDWDFLPFDRNSRCFFFFFLGGGGGEMERQSYHLIQSFGCRCFLGHKLENTNRESRSNTQVPITITSIISHLESYSCVIRSLLIMATRIKQLLRQKRCGRVTSLESAILGIIAFTSRK